MNNLWLYILVVFSIQEQTSTNALILSIREHGIPAWPVHLAWVALSALDILLGYGLGHWTHERIRDTKIGRRLDGYARGIERYLGVRSETFILVCLGILNFPYVNAFLCSWLKLDFKKAFLSLMLGGVISYWMCWETVGWISRVIPNPLEALGAAVVAMIAVTLLLRTLFNKSVKKS